MNESNSLIYIYVRCPLIRNFLVEGIDMFYPNIIRKTIDIIFDIFFQKINSHHSFNDIFIDAIGQICSQILKQRLDAIRMDKLRNHNDE